MGIITLNPLAPGAGDQQEVKPILKTWAQLKDARDAGNLIPGQYYRITDYVTTVNGATITNARSAGHPFDILMRADSVSTLNEQAWAVRHEGDTYFKDARLEAWELKYRLDNVQWSKQAGTYVTDEDNGYTFLVIGEITLSGHTYKLLQGLGMYVEDWSDYALMETVAEGEQIICYYGYPEEFNPEEPEVVGTASGVEEVTEAGTGTITWMKDEHGNECPYDFKNVQFKRWKVTDSMEGRTEFTDTYLGVLGNTAEKLSVEDAEDFIWAYTFSSDATGGEQTDYSLDGTHSVYDNIIKEMGDGSLPDNVFFGENCYANTLSQGCWSNSFSQNCRYNSFSQDCYNNSFSQGCSRNSFSQGCSRNSFSQDCYNNSFSQECSDNSFSQGCSGNSFSQGCSGNSFSQDCSDNSFSQGCGFNSFSQNCQYNSFSQDCKGNSFSQGCSGNSFSQDCKGNSFSQYCYNNSFSQNVQYVMLSSNYMQQVIVESGNQHLNVVCNQSTSASQPCRNIKIEQGVGNTTSEKTVTITTRNQNYQTVVKNANSVEVTA